MKDFYSRVMLHHGNCVDSMRTMPDNSVDSIVTDPPYELGFMGKSWDDSKGRWPANLIHDGSDEVTALFPGAARFFYCAKTSKKDRNEGLEDFISDTTSDGRAIPADNAYQRGKTERQNTHPTVKPTDLMRYLCRMVTPPNGVILDPFLGSGSTGKAAVIEGFRFIGCELSAEYIAIASRRIFEAGK